METRYDRILTVHTKKMENVTTGKADPKTQILMVNFKIQFELQQAILKKELPVAIWLVDIP